MRGNLGTRLSGNVLQAARRQPLLFAIFLATGLWLGALVFMSTVPLTGDEGSYNDKAAAIANFFVHDDASLKGLAETLVGRGWFLPGMPLVLTPLYILEPSPSLEAIRIYSAGVAFLVWLWTLRELHKALGNLGSVALLIFPTLSLTWLLFSSTTWGEVLGGLLVAIVGARTYTVSLQALKDSPICLRDVVTLELLMVAAVYIRSNLIAVALALHIFLLALFIIRGTGVPLFSRLCVLAVGAVVFTTLLAPWSLTASYVLGDPVVTTPKLPLAVAKTFGDRGKLCFGKCPSGNIHHVAVEYSREYAQEHGISEVEAQKRMAGYALNGVETGDYLRQVRRNYESFLLTPSRFSERFIEESKLRFTDSRENGIVWIANTLTVVTYFPLLGALVAANLLVVFKLPRLQVFSLIVKMLTLCLLIQPFFQSSHPRYWIGIAPLMSFSAILLGNVVAGRYGRGPGNWKAGAGGSWDDGSRRTRLILAIIQMGYVTVVTGTGLVLFLVGV
jgi:hypothetical protein